MIITINQRKFKEALNINERVVLKSSSLPILQNIVLKTESGRLKISSTNLEIGINSWIGAKIEEDGEIALPARLLLDFISNLQSEKVTINTKENIAFINADDYKTKIIGFTAKDFPIIPRPKSSPFVSLAARDLCQLFISVVDSCSLSEARPELSGVYVRFSDTEIESAATDSFRLAEKIVLKKAELEQSVIIPRFTIQEVVRIFGDKEEEVSLAISENQIFFFTTELEVVSRLIDGHYPDYKKVIPDKFLSKIMVKKSELEKGVRLASIFSSTIADIKIQAEKDSLKILAKNTDKGEVTSTIKGNLKGSSFAVSVNFRYILDGIKVISSENIVLEFTGEGSPLMIKPEDHKDFLYLIMPLRS